MSGETIQGGGGMGDDAPLHTIWLKHYAYGRRTEKSTRKHHFPSNVVQVRLGLDGRPSSLGSQCTLRVCLTGSCCCCFLVIYSPYPFLASVSQSESAPTLYLLVSQPQGSIVI